MLVDLAATVFAEDLADPLPLYDLLRTFVDGPHQWVTNPAVITAVEQFMPKHLPVVAGTFVALARDSMVVQAWVGTSQATQVVSVGPADLADHSADLCRTAVLVVEDLVSDGQFVETIAHVFAAARVVDALNRGWLEIRHSGGSRLVSIAEAEAQPCLRVVRVVALLDSDAKTPGQRTANHDRAAGLAALGLATHVLTRREIENYVPNKVLTWKQPTRAKTKALTLLKQLTDDQRSHYDMKKGFRKHGDPPAILPDQATLFANLDPKVRLGLHDGFGDGLIRKMHEGKEALAEQDFAQLGAEVVGELRTLLATIVSRI